MICPACGHTMSEQRVHGVAVDVCRAGCGGVWFDNHELDRVDEAFEDAPDDLLDVPHDPAPLMDAGARRNCPRCDDLVMMRHYFTVKREVEVDECPGCGGFFLDHGELAAIRAQFDREDDRREAARAYYAEAFDQQLDDAAEASEASLARARRFAGMIRLLLPSHWLPGKQPWGAF